MCSLELKIIASEVSLLGSRYPFHPYFLPFCLPAFLPSCLSSLSCPSFFLSFSLFLFPFIFFLFLLKAVFPVLYVFNFATWILLPASESCFRNRVFYFQHASKITLLFHLQHTISILLLSLNHAFLMEKNKVYSNIFIWTYKLFCSQNITVNLKSDPICSFFVLFIVVSFARVFLYYHPGAFPYIIHNISNVCHHIKKC